MVQRATPESMPAKLTEILPRLKDGGAFVKFSHPPELAVAEIEGAISKHLQQNPVKPLFNPFTTVHAGLVKGVPWLEDLHRFPTGRLRVEFVPKNPGEEAAEISQEDLYSIFRRYGKIAEITSQPFDSKAVPKYAYVDFAFTRDAIMARNCLHGIIVPADLGGGKAGTKLRMSYGERVKSHHFWNWLTSHPRIVIPILVGILTGITVAVFDPIRSFFVKAHVQKRFRLSNSRLYRWLRRQTSDIFTTFGRHKTEQAGLEALWSHRKELIGQIQRWLMETAETFTVVQGPRGSGKKDLVLDQALKGRRNVLVLDCKPIVEARGESATIKKIATQVGYRPIFSWMTSVSSLMDLAVQSTTGVKAGFSETLESQLQKVLQATATALTEIGVSGRKKDDSDAALPDDAYLEAHPESRPVVVIDNFLHKNEGDTIVYDKIAEWAAALVQSNVAHVIFLTTDASYSKSLSKSLPDRVFRQVALGDLSPDVAMRFIISHLEGTDAIPTDDSEDSDGPKEKQPPRHGVNLSELDDVIGTVGGRLTDLEFLARRLKANQTPKQAIEEITDQSASEILKIFLLAGSSKSDGEKRFSTEQAWYVIKALASNESLRYNQVLLSNTFASSMSAPDGEAALDGLANAELITVKSYKGRPQRILPGRPVYQAAFTQLTKDTVLSAKMDLAMLTELSKIEVKNIEKVENELALLGALPKQPAQAAGRISYLLAKMEASQTKINGFEKEMAQLKKVLSSED